MKNKIYKAFFIGVTLLNLTSCFDTLDRDSNIELSSLLPSEGIDNTLEFSGLSSVSQKTDSTITLNWTAHADAISYAVFDTKTGIPWYLQTLNGQSTTSVTLTNLTPNQTYKFRVRMLNSKGQYDTNTNDIFVTMNAVPDAPTGITLSSPSYSPTFDSTPTLQVSGVKNGDIVKLYSDAGCATEVASGTATSTSILLTTSTLSPASFTFYAKSIGITANSSACSTASVNYTYNMCPPNYIPVPHNTSVGTTADFCVAKYEMKNVASVATSQASGAPWVSIDQTNSKLNCTALNALNGVSNKFALISNPEWMTIARNIEQQDSNWSPVATVQLKGVGVLARGHSDNKPANALAASSDDTDGYYLTGNNSSESGNAGWEQRRTLTLSNNEVIWDFSSNVWEWVDWQVTPALKAYQSGTNISTDQGWKEFYQVDRMIGENGIDEMLPETWASSFVNFVSGVPDMGTSLNGNNGIGRYYAGVSSSGGAALRGGVWDVGTNSGAFTLYLNASAADTVTFVGFRCVFRP